MKSTKPIQISIPHPCTQSWDEMTPTGSGRFCDHCQKTVIDFTTYSDAALYNFFSKKDGPVCGRYFASQLDRPISIPYQPHSRLYRIAVAFGLTILIANGQQAQARKMPPLVEQSFYRFSDDTTKANKTDTTGSISGTMLDDKKEPLINAAISVYQGDSLKGGTVTDFDGNYVIKPPAPGYYDVLILSPGFDTIKIMGVKVGKGHTVLNYAMQRRSPLLHFTTGLIRYSLPLTEHDEPTKKTYTREELEHRR